MADRGASSDLLFALRATTAGYAGRSVLHGVDLAIRQGERVAIMGRSGAGKSTLLNLLYAERPRDVALVPQAAALVKVLSVFHNVYMGRLDRHSTAHNLRNLIWPTRQDLEAVGEELKAVDLADKIHEVAGALSGGQQQRTSVARSLFNGRRVLLADEPVSALDRVQGSGILTLLRRRFETLVVVLHDVPLALEHFDRIVVLEQGRKTIDAPAASMKANDLIDRIGGIGP